MVWCQACFLVRHVWDRMWCCIWRWTKPSLLAFLRLRRWPQWTLVREFCGSNRFVQTESL